MLKETPRSLRQYFTLIAILSLLPFILAAFQQRWSAFASMSAIVDLGFVGLFIYIAVRFYVLLKKPTLILAVLTLGAASMLVSHVARFIRGDLGSSSIAIVVISLLVYWYLFRSVTRLSREAAQQNA